MNNLTRRLRIVVTALGLFAPAILSVNAADSAASNAPPAATGVAPNGRYWKAPPLPAGKFTYVLVHGAWGGGWAFRQVESLLVADGHRVFRPTLTGQGEKVHLAGTNVDLTTHITDVVNVILWEDLHDIVLVGHSYGGMVITGVADRVPDRIKHILYLDAALPENGESFNTAAGNGIARNVVDGFIPAGRGTENTPLPHDVPHPAKTLSEPIALRNQDAVKKIPTTYALFVATGRTPEQANFYKFYQRAQARGWTMLTLQSDHNAQWSHPKELTALLEKAP